MGKRSVALKNLEKARSVMKEIVSSGKQAVKKGRKTKQDLEDEIPAPIVNEPDVEELEQTDYESDSDSYSDEESDGAPNSPSSELKAAEAEELKRIQEELAKYRKKEEELAKKKKKQTKKEQRELKRKQKEEAWREFMRNEIKSNYETFAKDVKREIVKTKLQDSKKFFAF